MRLLQCIHSVNPAFGGPIESIKQIFFPLEKAGHRMEVATLDLPDDTWVKDFPFPIHAFGTRRSSYGCAPGFVPWLQQHRGDYDAVLVNGLWLYNGRAVWLALRKSNTPYFVFPHGMLDPWFKRRYPLKHLKKWSYWLWTEYRLLRDAAAVLFTCEEERQLARQTFWPYHCREQVVNFGTASPKGDALQQKEIFLEKFPVLRGRHLVLFLSRLHEKKGCDLLIKAFAQTRGSRPNDSYSLVMAGPCEDTEYAFFLQRLAQESGLSSPSIVWTGMISGDVKWGAFHASEVFVLPSHQENFGIAVVEALACSLPVLISQQVNIWREIESDGAGLVEKDDQNGAVRLLDKWNSLSQEQRAVMRSSAKSCFMKRFEIQQAAESLVASLRGSGVKG